MQYLFVFVLFFSLPLFFFVFPFLFLSHSLFPCLSLLLSSLQISTLLPIVPFANLWSHESLEFCTYIEKTQKSSFCTRHKKRKQKASSFFPIFAFFNPTFSLWSHACFLFSFSSSYLHANATTSLAKLKRGV